MAESITITDNRTGNQLEIPIRNGGVAASEWSKLLPGIWFYDPGFVSTAACESSVSFVDGDAGILRYRGYPIASWPSTPTTSRSPTCSCTGSCRRRPSSTSWRHEITYHTYIHENVRKRFLEGFHYDAHPMGMLVSAVAALSTFYLDAKDIFDPESRTTPDHPAHRQDAHTGRRRPPVLGGDALRLPRQLPRFRRQLPVHDVEGGRAPLRRQPHAGPGPRHPVHPPRRPRAELLDHGHAGGRVVARRSRTRAARPPAPRSTGPVTAVPTRWSSACSPRSARSRTCPPSSTR